MTSPIDELAGITTEEAALLDSLDECPFRVLRIAKARLRGVTHEPRLIRHMDAALDRLARDIKAADLDTVELDETRSLAAIDAWADRHRVSQRGTNR